MFDSPQFVTLDGGLRLAYYRFGNPDGTPLVLVHGYTSRAKAYEPVIPALEEKFNILVFDQRGHGASDKPVGDTVEATVPLYDLDLFADNIQELVAKTDFPTPFVIFGHSMGGMITQVFVLKYPALVSHVVLASTLPTYKTDNMRELLGQFKSGKLAVNEATFRMMESIGSSARWRRQHKDLVEESLQYKVTLPEEVYIACLENFVEHFDVRDQLASIQQPTLVITGNRDGLVQYTNSEFMASQIPNAKLVIIPKLSHNILHEATDTVVAELDAFVE